MNDLDTINTLIEKAVENSSYVTVLISSGVFILYTLIIKVVDLYKARDRNRPIIEMTEAIKDISENVLKLNAVLDKTFKDAEIKNIDRTKTVVELAFDSFRVNVSKSCEDIIIHNNIHQNKEYITQNVYKYISTEYYKLYSIFSSYEINDIVIATKLKETWIDEVTKECLSIIYNEQDAINRVNQINNKLQLIANEYSVYINNKTFN